MNLDYSIIYSELNQVKQKSFPKTKNLSFVLRKKSTPFFYFVSFVLVNLLRLCKIFSKEPNINFIKLKLVVKYFL